MFELILDLAAPRRSWRRVPVDCLARVRATWLLWSTLDPLTREYEAERAVRGIALGVVLAFIVWAAFWLVWSLA